MNKKNVMILDDQDSMRLILNSMLKKQYKVISMSNAIDALTYLRQNKPVDLILLDANMPQIDGLTFLKTIKRSLFFKSIPVIIISGQTDTILRKKITQLGADDFVSKPFDSKQLRLKIEHLLTLSYNSLSSN